MFYAYLVPLTTYLDAEGYWYSGCVILKHYNIDVLLCISYDVTQGNLSSKDEIIVLLVMLSLPVVWGGNSWI